MNRGEVVVVLGLLDPELAVRENPLLEHRLLHHDEFMVDAQKRHAFLLPSRRRKEYDFAWREDLPLGAEVVVGFLPGCFCLRCFHFNLPFCVEVDDSMP